MDAVRIIEKRDALDVRDRQEQEAHATEAERRHKLELKADILGLGKEWLRQLSEAAVPYESGTLYVKSGSKGDVIAAWVLYQTEKSVRLHPHGEYHDHPYIVLLSSEGELWYECGIGVRRFHSTRVPIDELIDIRDNLTAFVHGTR